MALVGLRKQLIVQPTRIPRHLAIRRIIELSRDAKAEVISVYGSDEAVSRAFAQDLATVSGGGLSNSAHENVYENGSHDLKDLPAPLPRKHFNVSLKPAKQIDTINSFKVLLQTDPEISHKLDVVLDVSAPDHPALLHPRGSRFTFNPLRYRLKRRRIPLARYAVQVLLFLLINLLNNAAFAYHVPMAVHIIFRSGGLVVNMLMGWAFEKRRLLPLFTLVISEGT